jgi:hypothetical protein
MTVVEAITASPKGEAQVTVRSGSIKATRKGAVIEILEARCDSQDPWVVREGSWKDAMLRWKIWEPVVEKKVPKEPAPSENETCRCKD